MPQILILVDEQDRKTGPDRLPYSAIVVDHLEGDEGHVVRAAIVVALEATPG